jgi:hypothetical protein
MSTSKPAPRPTPNPAAPLHRDLADSLRRQREAVEYLRKANR